MTRVCKGCYNVEGVSVIDLNKCYDIYLTLTSHVPLVSLLCIIFYIFVLNKIKQEFVPYLHTPINVKVVNFFERIFIKSELSFTKSYL